LSPYLSRYNTTNIRHVSLFLVCTQREPTKDWVATATECWFSALFGERRFNLRSTSPIPRLGLRGMVRTRPHAPTQAQIFNSFALPRSLRLSRVRAHSLVRTFELSKSPHARARMSRFPAENTRVYACPDFQQKTCTLFLSRLTYPRSPACIPDLRPSFTLLSASFWQIIG
jgi:hypothetical protein